MQAPTALFVLCACASVEVHPSPLTPRREPMLVAGSEHACLLREDRSVWCWGRACTPSPDGQPLMVCDGEPMVTSGTPHGPSSVVPQRFSGLPGEPVRLIGSGGAETCAELHDGSVWCWGGLKPFHFVLKAPKQIAFGPRFGCAVTDSAEARCWGDGSHGELGGGRREARSAANRVAELHGVSSLATGHNHACALLKGGAVDCWGSFRDDEFGSNGAESDRLRPVALPLPSPVRTLAAGGGYTCALESSGAVRCFGGGTSPPAIFAPTCAGGPCRLELKPVPPGAEQPIGLVPADGLVGGLERVRQVAVGRNFACALEETGTVQCWALGHDSSHFGQLGFLPSIAEAVAQRRRWLGPARRVEGVTGAVELVAGDYFACARTGAGEVLCWGAGTVGQLGDGQSSNSAAPVRVAFAAPDEH